MEKQFKTNKERIKQCSQAIKRRHRGYFISRYFLCALPTIISILWILYISVSEQISFFEAFRVFALLLMIPVAVGAWGFQQVGEKYLTFANSKMKNNVITISNDKIVQSGVDTWDTYHQSSTTYVETTFRTKDIERIEYDKQNMRFYIIGCKDFYQYDNIQKGRVLEKYVSSREKQIKHAFEEVGESYEYIAGYVIPDIFENSEQIQQLLKEIFQERYIEKSRSDDETLKGTKEAVVVFDRLKREKKI